MSRLASRRGAVGALMHSHDFAPEARHVEYASMRSARMNILAGTALALILAAADASAAPQATPSAPPAAAAPREYSTPGSMTKPSTPIMPADDGMRFRSTSPTAATGLQPR